MSFSKILGQEKALAGLKAAISSGRVPPGLLFYGPAGVGKMTVAQEFAKALNCRDALAKASSDSCGECLSCLQAEKKIHPDVVIADYNFQAALLEKEPQKQQHILIDTVRELTARAQQKPALGGWKVFIIDRADTMLPAAASALLKLLEEPPEKTVWILIAEKKSALLSTIVSRCRAVAFAPLSEEALEEILAEKATSLEESRALAALSGGSLERAARVKNAREKLADLDRLDPLYPFRVSAQLPKELAAARREAALLLELLAEDAHRRWKTETAAKNRDALKRCLEKIFKYRSYINKNVSPHSLVEAAMVETEPLKLTFFGS